MTEDQIADHLTGDAYAQRWGAFGEVGTSMEMHPTDRTFLRAVSQAHSRTRLPIFTHTAHDGCASCAVEQLDLFESQGMDPSHLCIGHVSDVTQQEDPDSRTHKAIAARGAFLGFDTVGRALGDTPRPTSRFGKLPASFSDIPEAAKIRLVLSVLEAGYAGPRVAGVRFLELGRSEVQPGERVLDDPGAIRAKATTRRRGRGDASEDLGRQLAQTLLAFVPTSSGA